MKSNLFIKFYLAILFVILTILVSYGMVNINDQKNSNIKIMETQASIIAKTILLANVEAILSNDSALLIESSLEFFKENKGVKYLVFNQKDKEKIVVYNNRWNMSKNLDSKYTKLQHEYAKYSILKADLYDKELFHYAFPIKIASFNWGWIHIGFSLDEYNKNLQKIYDNFIYITLIAFLVSVVFTYIFTKWMLKPILELNKTTKAIVLGDYRLIPNLKRSDEIYELTYNFNLMVKYLIKTKKDVKESKNLLEQKVKIRTKELNDLNEHLDKRVHEEVEKRQKQEKYLHEQIKMAQMGEMLNNIAHQWRQPLSVITTATSGLKLKKDLDLLQEHEFDDTYKVVMENANYLTKIIDTFSKYTQEDYNIEYVDLKDVIEDIITLNIDILKKNFVHINISYPKDSISLETVPSLLSQVLFNILMNANNALSKKSIENKNINLDVKAESDYYLIEISDNAGGIKENILEKIFEPYFTTKHKFKGVGMGLYLSYDIVINHLNGTLFVKNGKFGAIFTIKLPKML